ncbi:MAG: hypothetical protein IKJ65_09985 [Clostridia bacterium]|nr:hypothetical protein [Clostridia bacterium]
MKVEITYPPVSKRNFQRRRLLDIIRWPFLLAAYACPIINLAVGGKAWSVIALIGLYMVWRLVFSIDLVEYNRISQFIRLIYFAIFLMGMIDLFLAPGWAIEVLPIVCFCALAVAAVLFFTDFSRQRRNMLPMLGFIAISFVGALTGLAAAGGRGRWAFIVLGSLAAALFVACAIAMGADFMRELKRRFHIR